MHRLTDALEQLRRFRQVLEGVRVHELASLNDANLQEYNNLLRAVDTRLCDQGMQITYWDELELIGLPESAKSLFSLEHGLSQDIEMIPHLTAGQHDAWLWHFLILVNYLRDELETKTGRLIISHPSDDDMPLFFEHCTLLCQRLGDVLRHVYDWQVHGTSSPHKKMIQEDVDWSEWFTACVWITTRIPDATCRTLYAECVSAEKTLQQELQYGVLQHVVDNKEHYEPKLPDDKDVGFKMSSRHITTMSSNSELIKDKLNDLKILINFSLGTNTFRYLDPSIFVDRGEHG